jgi:ABC-type multidrug transport system ATPase subunit
MGRARTGPTPARGTLGALQAEVALAARLAARHPVSRAAVAWAIGLGALARILAGPSPDAVAPVLVGLAGFVAAAAGPRPFVRGGPFESLRWVAIPPAAAVAARLAGTVIFSCVGAALAAVAVAGPAPFALPGVAAAAVHATIIAGLAAVLAAGFGCQAATVLPLLLVAVGAGGPYTLSLSEAGPSVAPLPPPGTLVAGLLDGRVGATVPRLLVWLSLVALGVGGMARRLRRRGNLGPPATPAAAVVCDQLTCADPGADGRRLLDGVTLTIEPGEVVAVVGVPHESPGALLRAAAGLRAPSAGRVVTAGHGGRSAAGFGYLRAGHTGPPDLEVVEWLRYVADHSRRPARARATRVQAALGLVGLGPDAGRRIGHLDRDAVERLAVATGAVSGAAVLLLDACFAGVHAATRQVLTDALADLAAQGRTILLAPRDVRAVEPVATRVIILRDGRRLADLRMTALQQERVAELRLNGGALAAVPRLAAHFPDAVRTGTGLDVPLARGRTLEAVLAVCRSERIPVLGSRVRYRTVDDLFQPATRTPDPERAAALG